MAPRCQFCRRSGRSAALCPGWTRQWPPSWRAPGRAGAATWHRVASSSLLHLPESEHSTGLAGERGCRRVPSVSRQARGRAGFTRHLGGPPGDAPALAPGLSPGGVVVEARVGRNALRWCRDGAHGACGATPAVSRCKRSTCLMVATSMPSRRAICPYLKPTSWKSPDEGLPQFPLGEQSNIHPLCEDQAPPMTSTAPRVRTRAAKLGG